MAGVYVCIDFLNQSRQRFAGAALNKGIYARYDKVFNRFLPLYRAFFLVYNPLFLVAAVGLRGYIGINGDLRLGERNIFKISRKSV